MKKSIKSLCSIFLVIVMICSVCIISVNAETTDSYEGVKIVFHKPDNWGNNINIHLWNAGSENTSWPGKAMSLSYNGTYTYSSTDISSCNFVINDGLGNQTNDLYAEGYVGVKDNHVFAMSDTSVYVRFKAPSNWGSDIKMYYYSNDENEVALTPWPGKAMSVNGTRDGHYAIINDMSDIRILFTDGTHQYPASGQPGIPLKAGQELIFDQNKYSINNNYKSFNVNQPTTFALTGQDYSISVDFSYGNDFLLFFRDQNDNTVNPKNVIETRNNDKIIYEYIFNFSESGSKILTPYYVYHSSYGRLTDDITIDVLDNMAYNSHTAFADKYDMNIGDTFTITTPYLQSGIFYNFRDADNNEIEYNRMYETTIDGNTFYNFVFTADKIGRCQVININQTYTRNPLYEPNVSKIMINVWQPVN